MNQRAVVRLAVVMCVLPALRADVTVRYQTDFKTLPALQPFVEKLMKSNGGGTSVRMKDSKAYTTSGNWVQIFDFVKQEVTVMDPEHKSFAVLPVSQLSESLAAAMPQPGVGQSKAADLISSIKTTAESKMTGQTSVIQGIQAEEREVTIHMEMPATGASHTASSMRLVIHIWTAKPSEVLNVPAIRELAGYNAWQKYILNPAGMLEKMTGKMPGVSSLLGPLMAEISKDQSVVLRMHMELHAPFTAMLAKQMAKPGDNAPAIDPDAPFMEVNQEISELSSAPVDGALFEIPKDYTSVPAHDIFRSMFEAQKPAIPAEKQ